MNCLSISELPLELRSITEALLPFTQTTIDPQGLPLTAVVDPRTEGLQITLKADGVHITAQSRIQFSRALGLAAEALKADRLGTISQVPCYRHLETMVDCARNAVPTVESLKRFAAHTALMGYTGLQLYVEDVFELPGYPYFGYMRGAYSKEELQELDDYCHMLGMELVPCIQTLAHLGRALKWQCFEEITDFDDILLADDPRTYAFIEAMVETMASTLRSRRINLGMDEAHMVGLGKYLDRHGYQDRIQLMIRHFEKVRKITDRYGYQVMIWSDMFFRLLTGDKYEGVNLSTSADFEALRKQIPQDVELIYWNYYSPDEKTYDSMLKAHFKMSDQIGFAAGAWKWTSLSPYNSYSLHVSPPAHSACQKNKISHVLVTTWGDDGGECSLFSVLPSFQYWAEACYQQDPEENQLASRFKTCTGGCWEDFLHMDDVLVTPENPRFSLCDTSPNKYFLYQDILCGLFDRHVCAEDRPHFEKTALLLKEAAERNQAWQQLFLVQASLCRLLAAKVNAGVELYQAYHRGDRCLLQCYRDDRLPELLVLLDDFLREYTRQWTEENKIFGLDLFDLRIGGLRQRIQRAISRISLYLDGTLQSLEELEQPRLYFDCRDDKSTQPLAVRESRWSAMATVSASRNLKSY